MLLMKCQSDTHSQHCIPRGEICHHMIREIQNNEPSWYCLMNFSEKHKEKYSKVVILLTGVRYMLNRQRLANPSQQQYS